MNASPQDWLEEAVRRLGDARLLLQQGRPSRAVSATYYAVHAAGKGLLLTVEGIDDLASHDALYKLVSRHFVRPGKLPRDTAALIQGLFEKRLAADYELRHFSATQARALLSEAETLIDRLDALA